MAVEDIVDADIEGSRMSCADSITEERPDVPADKGRHLAVVDRGEIVDRDVVATVNQASRILPLGHRGPMSGLVGEEGVHAELTALLFRNDIFGGDV